MTTSGFAESAAALVVSPAGLVPFRALSSCSLTRASSSLVRLKRSHAAREKNIAYTSPLTDPPPCARAPSRSEPQIIALPPSTHLGWALS
jgi:hypothetical protein